MKRYINKKTVLICIIAALASFKFGYAQKGRIAIESVVAIKKSGDDLLAKEGKKDMLIKIDKTKLTTPEYVIFWVEDSNNEVVKSIVLDEDMLTNKIDEIKGMFEISKKDFLLKLTGLNSGDYQIHIRVIINEDLMYVIDKSETVTSL